MRRWCSAAACVAAVALAGCGDSGSDDPSADAAATTPTRTEARTDAEREARRIARRYVRAMREADRETLCATSSDAERRRAGGICEIAYVAPLGGPTPKVGVPEVDDDEAVVRVRRLPEDTLVLELVREDGEWGIDAARLESPPDDE